MARRGQRQSGTTRTAPRQQRGSGQRPLEKGDIIRVLARAVREVEAKAQRGPLTPAGRTKFQVVAVLVREERTRVKNDKDAPEAHRAEQLKRLDGVAQILAQTVALDPTVYPLLDENAVFTDAADTLRTEMLQAAGIEAPADDTSGSAPVVVTERRVVPQSVVARQLANPFLAPDFSAVEQRPASPRRLSTWELLGPLFRAFEYGGASSCMPLPPPGFLMTPGGLELMPHQAQVVGAAAEGHRTFLLADEPGLGKTAQALMAAQAADAYPLMCVVPNVG